MRVIKYRIPNIKGVHAGRISSEVHSNVKTRISPTFCSITPPNLYFEDVTEVFTDVELTCIVCKETVQSFIRDYQATAYRSTEILKQIESELKQYMEIVNPPTVKSQPKRTLTRSQLLRHTK